MATFSESLSDYIVDTRKQVDNILYIGIIAIAFSGVSLFFLWLHSPSIFYPLSLSTGAIAHIVGAGILVAVISKTHLNIFNKSLSFERKIITRNIATDSLGKLSGSTRELKIFNLVKNTIHSARNVTDEEFLKKNNPEKSDFDIYFPTKGIKAKVKRWDRGDLIVVKIFGDEIITTEKIFEIYKKVMTVKNKKNKDQSLRLFVVGISFDSAITENLECMNNFVNENKIKHYLCLLQQSDEEWVTPIWPGMD
jgi:hypothetical protein